jgi:hypothetical protein
LSYVFGAFFSARKASTVESSLIKTKSAW